MTSRLVAGGLIWGALLAGTVVAHAADARPATRSTGQAVGRSSNFTVPKLQAQQTCKLADSKSAAGRMRLASAPKLTANAQVLAAAKSAGRRAKLNPQPARSDKSEWTGPRSPSGVLQFLPAKASPPSGQKVYRLVPQPKSGQKVLTLVPQPQPPAADRPAEILQFQSDDEPQPAATIMPLGTDKKSEPAATILQFED